MTILRSFCSLARSLLVGVLTTIVSVGAAASSDWDIDELLDRLSKVEMASLEFVEKKKSMLLTVDLESSGTIVYRAPDYMKKTIVNPVFESILIDGDVLTIEKTTLGGKKEEAVESQRYSISSNSLLSSTVGSVLAILAGNRVFLEEDYDIRLSGDKSEWDLLLLPKPGVIKDKIEQIVLAGSGIEIWFIETTYPDGDQSSLSLSYTEIE
ncbi:MAG: hypothetical protein GKR96_13855 [Gammaproteobacteria bacterium]|nr:hypothetical protein [Gammaproteobacteria bacterium]